jgi:glycosyltransferase involved in cell wall biosynthesis
MGHKMKIVWLCYFSNAEAQTHLPLWKNIDEYASWIPNMVKGFECRNDIELHIIAPHEYLKKTTSFELRNIKYHFVPVGMPIYRRHWPSFFRYDVMSDFAYFRRKTKYIVKQIQPDVVNLIGAENAHYSSAILDFKNDYPVIIGIQGFISQFKELKNKSLYLIKRIEVEETILKIFTHFYGEQDSSTYIKNYNPNHNFYRLYFPVNEELAISTPTIEKIYDCIYYGKLSQAKGTEDFIKVIAELKKQKSDIKACIAGGGDQYPFKALAKELNCFQNIEFTGFLKTQKELFEHVKASRVFLAPPYFERLSSTIREAMYLKVPIVAYATGGIPYINEFDANIYMVPTGDYKAMAVKTLLLLNDETLRKNLAEKAYKYAVNEYSLSINTKRLISVYEEMLKKRE